MDKEIVDFRTFTGLLLASMDVVSPIGERLNPTVNPKQNLLMSNSRQDRASVCASLRKMEDCFRKLFEIDEEED